MSIKQVIFKLGEEEYGMDISKINAIEKYTGVVPVPNAPSYILGILNLRGDVVPVYSLRKKFGMPEAARDDKTQLLVTKQDGMLVGYKVDSVSEIVELQEEELQEVPLIVRNSETSYAKGVANTSERMVLLLDNERILSAQEMERMKDIQQ